MPAKQFFLNRRQFLRRVSEGATALGLLLLARCGLGGGDEASDRTFTTSAESGHTHKLTIKASQMASPPSAGTTITTTEVDSHTHDVDLTRSQLLGIGSHQAFTVTTSNENGHEHTVNFS